MYRLLILMRDFDIFVLAIRVIAMHREPEALIIKKQAWDDYCLLRLKTETIASESQPGQFIMIRPSENLHPLLRRPFSIHSVQDDCVEIFFLKSGIGTTLLSQRSEGDRLDILGPLGKGFHLENALPGRKVPLVGGGRGIAPLYFLARRLRELGGSPCIFYGGKTLSDLPLKQKFEKDHYELYVSTDDGSFGFEGFITDLFQRELENLSPSCLFSCGPEAMMRKLARVAQERSIPAEFSLESIMGCGFGACWGCVRMIKTGSKEEWVKICEEGPVFTGKRIVWQDEES